MNGASSATTISSVANPPRRRSAWLRRWISRWLTENMPMWPVTCSRRTVPPLSACISWSSSKASSIGGLGGDRKVEPVLVDELAQRTLEVVGDLAGVVPGRTGTGAVALDDAARDGRSHAARRTPSATPAIPAPTIATSVVDVAVERAGRRDRSASCVVPGRREPTSTPECPGATPGMRLLTPGPPTRRPTSETGYGARRPACDHSAVAHRVRRRASRPARHR